MSDWNPEHRSAWDIRRPNFPRASAGAKRRATPQDDYELRRRATAIRARDERIARLEAALREIADDPTVSGECNEALFITIEEMRQCARDALAGKEEQK